MQTQFQKQGLIIYIESIIIKIKIYRTTILSVVLCGCESLSLTLREKRRLRVFENTVVRKTIGPKRDEVKGSENQTMMSFMIFIIYQHYSGQKIKKNETGGSCSTYGGRGKVHTGFGGGRLEGKIHLEDLGVDWKNISKWSSRNGLRRHGLDQSGSGKGQVMGSNECRNQFSGSIK